MIVDLTLPLLLDVCDRARPLDRREILAMRWDDDLDAWAEEIFDLDGARFCALDRDGVPAYAWGYRQLWRGSWSTWGIGTDRWPHVWREVTKVIRRTVIPALREAEAKSVIFWVLAEKRDALKWFGILQTVEVAELRGFGRGGEDFKVCQWRA